MDRSQSTLTYARHMALEMSQADKKNFKKTVKPRDL